MLGQFNEEVHRHGGDDRQHPAQQHVLTETGEGQTGGVENCSALDQVKLGGRRIERGEIDAALQALPHIAGAAAAVQRTAAGNQLLVGR